MNSLRFFSTGLWMGLVLACGGEETAPEAKKSTNSAAQGTKAVEAQTPADLDTTLFSADSVFDYSNEKIITWYVEGGQLNGESVLLLSQARFKKGAKPPEPLPATLQILTQKGDQWESSLLIDPEAAVFHKAIIRDNGILSVSGGKPSSEQKAHLKYWTLTGEEWTADTLWTGSWSGKNQRLRDFEIGDVDGDGQEEIVIATHDQGVIVVLENAFTDAPVTVMELDEKAETFVHEIELGDMNGDGVLEFFATPSDPNKSDRTQAGDVVMYTHADGKYTRHLVDHTEATHAKEILVTDMNGDGISEVFSAVEGEKADKKMVSDLEIRQFQFDGLEVKGHKVIATLPGGDQLRFMMAHDFDGDGRKELVVAPMKTGLYALFTTDGESYEAKHFFSESGGFEHATNLIDLDGDGTPEVYAADDNKSKSLRRFTWNAAK